MPKSHRQKAAKLDLNPDLPKTEADTVNGFADLQPSPYFVGGGVGIRMAIGFG